MGQEDKDEDMQTFIKNITTDKDTSQDPPVDLFKKMIPFRQRCEEYSTVKFPRLINLNKYDPPEIVDPFRSI